MHMRRVGMRGVPALLRLVLALAPAPATLVGAGKFDAYASCEA
jgi:hypothetical protein